MSGRHLLAYGLIALVILGSLVVAWVQMRRGRERHRDIWGGRPRRRR